MENVSIEFFRCFASPERRGSPQGRRGSARRHDLRTPTGGRRRVGRLRAKEVRGTSAAQPDDRPHASRSFGRITATGRSAVPKEDNLLSSFGVGGRCQTNVFSETYCVSLPPRHPPVPAGQPPLQGGQKPLLKGEVVRRTGGVVL